MLMLQIKENVPTLNSITTFSRAQNIYHDFGLERSYLAFSETSEISSSIASRYMK